MSNRIEGRSLEGKTEGHRIERPPEEVLVVGIYTSPKKEAPMQFQTEVEAVAGAGLVGDRYYSGNSMNDYGGSFRGIRIPDSDRQVTLISLQGINDANRHLKDQGKKPIQAGETRRNLLLGNIDPLQLDSLVGQQFTVGGVIMEGVERSTPCVEPPTVLGRPEDGPAFVKAFLPSGGIKARIVSGGRIRVGDTIALPEVLHNRSS